VCVCVRVCVCACVRVRVRVCVGVLACMSIPIVYIGAHIKLSVCFCPHVHMFCADVSICAPCCLCTQIMGVSAHKCIFRHTNVGGVSAEFLTQIGHEKGLPTAAFFTTAATRPAATRLAAIKNNPHKARVKQIFQCVTCNLNAFFKF